MGTIWSEYVLCDCFYIFFSARLFTEELMEDGMSSYIPDGQSVMNPASSFYAIHSTRILCTKNTFILWGGNITVLSRIAYSALARP